MSTPGTQTGQRRSLFCLPAMVVRPHTTRDFSSCTLLESRTHSSNLPVEGLSQACTAGLHARRGRRRDESSMSKVRSGYTVGHPLRFMTAQLGPTSATTPYMEQTNFQPNKCEYEEPQMFSKVSQRLFPQQQKISSSFNQTVVLLFVFSTKLPIDDTFPVSQAATLRLGLRGLKQLGTK